MLSWPADTELNDLLRRYYRGEAALWEAIRQHVEEELRQRQFTSGAYHIRFRSRSNGGYDVLIEDASAFAPEP